MSDPEGKKKKKKKGKNYFTSETEKAILEFQVEPTQKEKQKIFTERVEPAFRKLVENVIFVYKFHTMGHIDVLKNDCLTFLYENIYKFDGTRGHKAFSYFNVIAKHWFIQKVKVYKKRIRSDVHFDAEIQSTLEKEGDKMVVDSTEGQALDLEFFLCLKKDLNKWKKKFDKDQEQKVLEAVSLLLNNPDLINIYNKKAIYLFIREITGLNTKQVVTNLTKLRKKYDRFKKQYIEGEL